MTEEEKIKEELKRLKRRDFIEFGIPAVLAIIMYALFFIFGKQLI